MPAICYIHHSNVFMLACDVYAIEHTIQSVHYGVWKIFFNSKHKIVFVPFLYVKDCGLFKILENSFITKGEGEGD